MKILAFDPGTKNFGWACGCGYQPVYSGTLKASKGTWDERLAELAREVSALMDEHEPELVACEFPVESGGAGKRRNPAADAKVRIAAGVPFALAAVRKIEFMWINTTTVKGTEFSKDNPWNVAALLGEPLEQLELEPDRCDAVGVWMAAYAEIWEKRALEQADA